MANIRKHFYLLSGILSSLCLVSMMLLILAQIGARFIDVIIPSSEDFAGWLLSATIFFGLAYTFQNGGHIRVTILLTRLQSSRRFVEIVNLCIGLCISGFFVFYACITVYDSFDFQEVTDTYLALPLWIVQLPMGVGSLFFFIAMIDNFVILLQGNSPQYLIQESQKKPE